MAKKTDKQYATRRRIKRWIKWAYIVFNHGLRNNAKLRNRCVQCACATEESYQAGIYKPAANVPISTKQLNNLAEKKHNEKNYTPCSN